MKNLVIKKPITLLEALRDLYPNSSNTTLRKLLKNKRVLVDNKAIVQGNYQLKKDNCVSIRPLSIAISNGIHVIYEDKNFIVVNKPKGVLSVPLDTANANNVLQILRKHFQTSAIFAVHRIDKDTSGVIMFAKNFESKKRLNLMFKNHDLKREYVAAVVGNLKENDGTWTSSLVEFNDYEVKTSSNIREGKIAITHFSVIKRSQKFTFLKLTLQTGRKHQIRVHCKEAGHPIVGDKKYGPPSCNPISRMCLHSSVLEFNNPFTDKKMHFSAPIPPQFAKLGLSNFS